MSDVSIHHVQVCKEIKPILIQCYLFVGSIYYFGIQNANGLP